MGMHKRITSIKHNNNKIKGKKSKQNYYKKKKKIGKCVIICLL